MRRVLVCAILGCIALGVQAVRADVDPQVMTGLQNLLGEANKNREKLDKDLGDALQDMENTDLSTNKNYLTETALLNHESKVEAIRDKLVQNHQVIEFLNTFISKMESAKDPRLDAVKALGEMSHQQILSTVETGQDSKVWLFEKLLSIGIKNMMEPGERLADFLQDFMGNCHNIEKPISLSEFAQLRKYRGVSREKLPVHPPSDE